MGNKKRDKQRQIEMRRQMRKQDRQQKKKFNKKRKGAKIDYFKLSKQYVDFFNRFNKQIRMLKTQLKDVGGDGNCLFRSFADQVDGNQTAHSFMRQQACRHILQNQQFFIPFIDEDQQGTVQQYVKQMRKDGEWGGHLELQALSECWRCVIVIHKIGLEEVIIRPMTQNPDFGIIHLAYFQTQDFQHYLSVRDLQDESEMPAIQKLKPLNKNMYEYLLYEDQEEYQMQKQIQEFELIEKMAKMDIHQEAEHFEEQQEPFPNYPRNKKCKCGSKIQYKNCCFKQYQKKRASNVF